MNRLLLCSLWILLHISTAKAIWCFKCDMLNPQPKCPPGKLSFCWAGPNMSCSTARLYNGHARIYVQRICTHNCEEERLPKNSHLDLLSHEVLCCKRDFCNSSQKRLYEPTGKPSAFYKIQTKQVSDLGAMNKLLPLGLWMVLSPCPASTLWCFNCAKPFPGSACPDIQEFCWAGEGAACVIENFYIENTHMTSMVGCRQDCQDLHRPTPFMWEEIICCYRDYCNK